MPLPPQKSRVALIALAILALASACQDGPSAPSDPGLHIRSGASVTDTIGATVPLDVIAVGADGQAASDRLIIFEAVSSSAALPPGLSTEPSVQLQRVLYDTTDSRGAARVSVRLGYTAGAAAVIVRVPELGYVDTVQFTAIPGAAASIALSPSDTAIYVNQGFTVRSRVLDRGGNERSGDQAVLSIASGPATLGAAGAVTTTDFGRVIVRATMGAMSGTAMASVVPRAWVAAEQHVAGNGGALGIFLVQLDGSGRQRLADGLDNAYVSGQGFGWSPDGRDLAIARGSAVDLVTPGSAERSIATLPGPVFLGARFSHDGAWIHFARAGAGLFRVRPDGTELQHLGVGGTMWGEDYRPSPSPDGTAVVYGSYRSPCGQADCIRVLDIATNADRVYGANDFLVRGTNAAWSPTGELIAFASSAGVGVIRPDGTGQRTLAADVLYVSWIDWSPDGRWLMVSSGVGPPILFDVPAGTRMPVPTLTGYGATAWRP